MSKKKPYIDKWLKPTVCEGCEKTYLRKRAANRNFCSAKCYSDYVSRAYIEAWKSGAIDPTRAFDRVSNIVRHYLLKEANYACTKCGWDKRHPIDNRPLVQVHHIDGNARNNRPENLEVLCPNCHSMTPKHSARNHGNGRTRRRKETEKNKTGWTIVNEQLGYNGSVSPHLTVNQTALTTEGREP